MDVYITGQASLQVNGEQCDKSWEKGQIESLKSEAIRL